MFGEHLVFSTVAKTHWHRDLILAAKTHWHRDLILAAKTHWHRDLVLKSHFLHKSPVHNGEYGCRKK